MVKSLMNVIILGVLSLSCVTVHAELNSEFGRLFSKPAERERLDKLRQNQQLKVITVQEASPSEPDVENIPIGNTSPITMQGYVKRSDGKKGTLWINNQPVQEGDIIDNVQIGRINRKGFSGKSANTEGVDIQTGSGKRIRLKAGQMYEPETSQIQEMQVVEKLKQLKLEQVGSSEHGVIE